MIDALSILFLIEGVKWFGKKGCVMRNVSGVPLILGMVLLVLTVSCAEDGEKSGSIQQKALSAKGTVSVQEEESSTALVTMYELGSKRCIPCKAMKKVMDSLEVRYPKGVDIVFHDVWSPEGKPYIKEFGVRSIPTQVFHDASGKEIFRHEGFFALDKIVELLKKSGVSQ